VAEVGSGIDIVVEDLFDSEADSVVEDDSGIH
jgi:hypothetical protein